jgi:hypothetical protein
MPVKPSLGSQLRAKSWRKIGLVAGGIVGGLVTLDLIGFVATVYFSAELLQAAEAAGVSELLKL